jgi:DNA polymerase elongation subunit (family B)
MNFKLLDFQTSTRDDSFIIHMFGLNELGETFSVEIPDFKPLFYCRVPDSYTKTDKNIFLDHIKSAVGPYMAECILDCSLIYRKKLDGFDGQREHKFLCFKFKGLPCFHRVKNLWYHEIKSTKPSKFNKKEGFAWVLKKEGYKFKDHYIHLYEAKLPPLLRYLHIKNISPSGWIQISNYTFVDEPKTTCKYECIVNAKDIEPLLNKETLVPFKICSFDIEASSSHGDFPLPVKDYKKLAQNIVEQFEHEHSEECSSLLYKCIRSAFGFDSLEYIDIVYPKKPVQEQQLEKLFQTWIQQPLKNYVPTETVELLVIQDDPENVDDDDDEPIPTHEPTEYNQNSTVIDMMKDVAFDKDSKILELQKGLNHIFPKIEGDKVTFIGSTFVKHGTNKPYLNHCIVLGGCSPVENTEIECYDTEDKVLIAWKNLIRREDPDILIGYNTFGFDCKFMYHRAVETRCIEEFLELSRTSNLAGKFVNDTWKIEESTIFLASGEYNLSYFKLEGRLQIDLYTMFRRNYNLDSYKLDNVSAQFIGDKISKIVHKEDTNETYVYSKNLKGLEKTNYVVFEELSHSSDYYKNGKKFRVLELGVDYFVIEGIIMPDMKKQVRWCLAKDDVDHHDIFRLSKGSDSDRAIIAQYCIQDCNLVHHLFQKIDLLTEISEMASICSVPIDFIIMRGQSIKIASLIAKKCREEGILMNVIEAPEHAEGYEGAWVLDPACGFYFDIPIIVNDYNSLYPSVIIADNMSHDSLVSVKIYDLHNNLIKDFAVKNKKGEHIYDNLPNYKYVDIPSDTFCYVRKTPKSAAVKQKSGHMVCRFAQFPDNKKATIPSVLEHLLKARKDTRKQMELETDPFMKKILNGRQNAYKIAANSVYGQCGASTSMIYNKYVASSCTAGGRQMLIYAKTVVEEVYNNRDCQTSMGIVNVTAKCIYGDTDSIFYKFHLHQNGKVITGKDSLKISMELGIEAGELASSMTKLPHKLAFEKAIWPFCIFSKKRYIGDYYEEDTENCYRKSMGIVLKRRDNSPILKDVYGGVIDILMKEKNVNKAVEFVKNYMKKLISGQIPLDKLCITKSLRSGYKNPQSIAHKILADRIGKRDPGNKPKSGDRIKFAFIDVKKEKGIKLLQGNKIETPEYIKEKNLSIDYKYYITNQLMKPLQQVFSLLLEQLPGFNKEKYETDLLAYKELEKESYEKKETLLRNKEIKRLIFDEFI